MGDSYSVGNKYEKSYYSNLSERTYHEKYLYEQIELNNNVFYQAKVPGLLHRQIIDEHAKRGHRFVASIPTLEGANGKTLAFDLVFEVDE